MRKIKITLFLFFLNFIVYSQNISGIVFDKNLGGKLVGASVYIDGTTIGTTTDFEGFFELEIKNKINSSLVISYLGYETQILNTNEFENSKKIYLKTSENQLKEIILQPDLWSRKKKMMLFKSEFLGKTIASKYCKILNPKDIILIHNSSSNTLIAYADKPIIVQNKYLGYNIRYSLVDFEISFKYQSGFITTHKVNFSGTSFFTELKSKKKYSINREKSYYGSLIHFMKSLSNQELAENKFGIYYKKFPIYPYKYFNITRTESITKVEMTTPALSILYDMFEQSKIEILEKEENTFFIDEYGNHSPPYGILLSGDFGKKRISNLLPLNYTPKTEE